MGRSAVATRSACSRSFRIAGEGPTEGIDGHAPMLGNAHLLLLTVALALHGALEHDEEGRERHGLGEEIIRPLLYRFYRQLYRAVAGEHDHWDRRIHCPSFGSRSSAVPSGSM